MSQVDKLAVVPAELDIDFHHGAFPVELPRGLAAALERAIEPDEQVLWLARPNVLGFMSRSFRDVLIGLSFVAFPVVLLFLSVATIRRGGTGEIAPPAWFMLLWGVLFAVIGASLLLSPFSAWWLARRTLYVVTDRRAILIDAPWRRRIQSFAGERLLNATRNEDAYGRGDIILERLTVQNSKGRSSIQETGFFGLDDVKRVDHLMRATVTRGGGTSSRLPEFLRKHF